MRSRHVLLVVTALAASAWQARPALAAPCAATGADLVIDGITCQLSGIHTYNTVTVTNGGIIQVAAFDGTDKIGTGNLELRAKSISVDATSKITARGDGYFTRVCGDGASPTADGGGQGGCSVRDSGGGGAHFGRGGRGTKDITPPQTFPRDFEEDCGNGVTYSGTGVAACPSFTNCRDNDGLPTVAGQPYSHSIYVSEFGGSGGDKGCRDGDGTTLVTAGKGGGRIVLAGLNGGAGTVTLNGTLDASGTRGCGDGNDSAGGGAGGTVLVVGDQVTIGATAVVTSQGGLGGDTQGSISGGECPAPYQQSGTCDDCGGGGGGGIVNVLSGVSATISDDAVFNVSGALGGVCPICRGEAGGGVGELQISGGYVGELCDGYDNDFDSSIDEGFGDLACPGMTVPACMNGVPQQCPADVPACQLPVTDSRARFAVIVDTSGSMLGNLAGTPTFGDGSVDHPGRPQGADGLANDSRLFQAKSALRQVISAYPDIDFSLARYHQDESLNRSCQLAHTFECQNICCSYDNPANNTGPAPTPACTVDGGNGTTLAVLKDSPGDECINYSGTCGPPRRGADVIVGFGADINNYLMWLDGRETSFDATINTGAYCNFAGGGDCELRGTGPTPLASSLNAVEDYLTPIKACDTAASGGCRKYNVILLTDGAESCSGDPVAAASALRAKGINTYVVGFSTLASETAQLNQVAAAGGTGSAFLVGDDNALANALAQIVSGNVVFETCNNLDDDCDGRIDEDFPQKGNACDNGALGACRGTGTLVCNGTGSGLACSITNPGATPGTEVCNGLDDNCNGAIDEGITCTPGCVPTNPVDLCNGIDDDCDGQFEEDDPNIGTSCGATATPPCRLGTNACIGGAIVCVGAVDPGPEQCNGIDDNCDGTPDDMAPCPTPTSCVEGGCRLPCAGGEFSCPQGYKCEPSAAGEFCVPSACATCAPNETCVNDMCQDPCAGVTCAAAEQCRFGTCVDCNVLGCPGSQVCSNSMCIDDPCANVDCTGQCDSALGCSCRGGACIANCSDSECPTGARCGPDGACVADACAGVRCPDNQVCTDGVCGTDPCIVVTCPAGHVCDGGACIDDPCKLAECTGEYVCTVRDGAAVCLPTNPGHVPDLVLVGGGGCAVGGTGDGGDGGGPASSAVLGLALVGLVVRRRRSL